MDLILTFTTPAKQTTNKATAHSHVCASVSERNLHQTLIQRQITSQVSLPLVLLGEPQQPNEADANIKPDFQVEYQLRARHIGL